LQNSLEYDKWADDKRQKHATEKICLDKQEDKKQQADEYVEQFRELYSSHNQVIQIEKYLENKI